KGMTWEGGMRVPAIFWGPGNISPGVVTELGTTMDLFATFSSMAGVELPDDRVMDGVDQSKVLYREEYGPRDHVFYYRGTRLYAVRLGAFKAHFVTEGAYGMFGKREEHDPPLLFNLNHDPSEQYNISEDHPDILEKIDRFVQEHEAHLARGADQLAFRGDYWGISGQIIRVEPIHELVRPQIDVQHSNDLPMHIFRIFINHPCHFVVVSLKS